jgi:hypothetical protein
MTRARCSSSPSPWIASSTFFSCAPRGDERVSAGRASTQRSCEREQMQTSRSLLFHVRRLKAHVERIIAGGKTAVHGMRRTTASDVLVMTGARSFFLRDPSVRAGDGLPTGCTRPFIKPDQQVIVHDRFA